jgi:cytochrome c oxidase assembly factor CtaG
VLYISYLVTYLLNSWLEWNMAHLVAFTLIFVIGYLVIWAVIYLVNRNNTADLNEKLKKNRQLSDI